MPILLSKVSVSRILFAGLLLILFGAPLLFGCTEEWSEALLTLTVSCLSVLTLVAIASGELAVPKVFIAATPFHIVFILFIGWQFFMPLWTDILDKTNYQRGLRLSLSYYFLFNLVMLLCNSEKRLNILLLTLVGIGTVQAFYGIMMVLSGIEMTFYLPKTRGIGTVTGTLSTRNTFAGYMEMTLACGLGLLVGHLSNVKFDSTRERALGILELLFSTKILVRIALAIMVIALVMSHSRMGNAAFFSSMLISGAIFLWVRKKFTRNAIILFASLILVDTLIISQWFGLEKLINRFQQTIITVDVKETIPFSRSEHAVGNVKSSFESELITMESSEGRENAWIESMPIVKDFALKGSGYGSYYILFNKYRTGLARGFYNHAHNDYIETIIEFGLIGSTLLGSLGLMAVIISIKTLSTRNNKKALSGAFAALMGVTAIAIHAFSDFNLYTPANSATLCVLIAIAAISYWGSPKSVNRETARRRHRSLGTASIKFS